MRGGREVHPKSITQTGAAVFPAGGLGGEGEKE